MGIATLSRSATPLQTQPVKYMILTYEDVYAGSMIEDLERAHPFSVVDLERNASLESL